MYLYYTCSLFVVRFPFSFFFFGIFFRLLQTPFPSAFTLIPWVLLIFASSFVHFETFDINCVHEWHLHVLLLFHLFFLFNFSSDLFKVCSVHTVSGWKIITRICRDGTLEHVKRVCIDKLTKWKERTTNNIFINFNFSVCLRYSVRFSAWKKKHSNSKLFGIKCSMLHDVLYFWTNP